MRLFSQAISVLLPVFYLIILFIYAIIFFTKNKKLARRTDQFLLALIFFHGLEILLRSITLTAIPLSTIFDALSFFAFSILVIYYLIEISLKNKTTGFIVLLLPFLLQLISSMLYQWQLSSNPLLRNPVFAIHASATIIGYTGLTISALYAFMYIMLYHNIKYHHFGIIYTNLPPLDILEKLSIRSVSIGIMMLGIGIILGHLRAFDLFGSLWINDPKIIVTDFIWLSYFIGYLLFRLKNWHGRWMAYLSVSGFIILCAVNLFIFLLIDTFHNFK
jgi:ABC-type transport system involved in cytochrome c biogenesis permease subunit